jgi:hypothetical protein
MLGRSHFTGAAKTSQGLAPRRRVSGKPDRLHPTSHRSTNCGNINGTNMDLSNFNSACEQKLINSGELPNLFFAELINSREKSNLPAPENTASLEEWREVVGYEGDYEVGSHGRVRSFVTAPH